MDNLRKSRCGSRHGRPRHVTLRVLGSALLLVAVCGSLCAAGTAMGSWMGDFIDSNASGNAVYEAMAIGPSAVYDPATDSTVVAYQGAAMDPYVCVFSHSAGSWSAPVRVGSNAYLAQRMDTHGGPAIIRDADGIFHVFWGAHNTALLHATSATPGEPGTWIQRPILVEGQRVEATYPVPELFEHADGMGLRVWIRRGEAGTVRGDVGSIVTTDGVTWSRGDTIVESSAESLWYNSIYSGEHATHVALIRAPRTTLWGNADPGVRRGLYYVAQTDGVWTDASGAPLPQLPIPEESVIETCAVVPDDREHEVNQAVVRELPDGSPCILFLQGDTDAEDSMFFWRFTRLEASGWTEPVTIAETDNFFDAADLEVEVRNGRTYLNAYLTVGGEPDSQALLGDRYASRGGDIARFTSSNSGLSWSEPVWLKQQGVNERFNDPQVVRDAPAVSTAPRVLFCEWNNDASAYFHKVFLWGESGLAGRIVTPRVTRLDGVNRVATAVRASQQGYPVVAPTVVLARKDAFPDALCGAPLAHAYRAPVLLVSTDRLDAETQSEIQRLKPSRIVVLGGEASVSATTVAEARAACPDPKRVAVERIAGADRYETSRRIAARLRELKGTPEEVTLASGADFPDALAASSYAARAGQPVLLTRPDSLSQELLQALSESGAEIVYVVGGVMAVGQPVSDAIQDAGYSVDRAPGADRYETARLIIERGLNDRGLFRMQRFVVASGEQFPDAMTGGVLAARVGGPLILTRGSGSLPDPSKYVLDRYADKVIDAYVMGGQMAVDDAIVSELQIQLIGDSY